MNLNHNTKEIPYLIKRLIWHKGILYWWYKLRNSKNEFDNSLMIDSEIIQEMNDEKLHKYFKGIYAKRRIAHKKEEASYEQRRVVRTTTN